MDRYETQLQKYAALSKNKDPTVWRDEAVRLHEARKVYVHLSGQHMMRVVNFRGLLSNLLVERLSSNMKTKEAFDELSHVWKDLNSSIVRWKQWLVDVSNTFYCLDTSILLLTNIEYRINKLASMNYASCSKYENEWKVNISNLCNHAKN